MTTILDPTNESSPVGRQLAFRPNAIEGNIALLDISKPKGNILLDRLKEKLSALLPLVKFTRYIKPTFSRPAPDRLRHEINMHNHFVIEALAD